MERVKVEVSKIITTCTIVLKVYKEMCDSRNNYAFKLDFVNTYEEKIRRNRFVMVVL